MLDTLCMASPSIVHKGGCDRFIDLIKRVNSLLGASSFHKIAGGSISSTDECKVYRVTVTPKGSVKNVALIVKQVKRRDPKSIVVGGMIEESNPLYEMHVANFVHKHVTLKCKTPHTSVLYGGVVFKSATYINYLQNPAGVPCDAYLDGVKHSNFELEFKSVAFQVAQCIAGIQSADLSFIHNRMGMEHVLVTKDYTAGLYEDVRYNVANGRTSSTIRAVYDNANGMATVVGFGKATYDAPHGTLRRPSHTTKIWEFVLLEEMGELIELRQLSVIVRELYKHSGCIMLLRLINWKDFVKGCFTVCVSRYPHVFDILTFMLSLTTYLINAAFKKGSESSFAFCTTWCVKVVHYCVFGDNLGKIDWNVDEPDIAYEDALMNPPTMNEIVLFMHKSSKLSQLYKSSKLLSPITDKTLWFAS